MKKPLLDLKAYNTVKQEPRSPGTLLASTMASFLVLGTVLNPVLEIRTSDTPHFRLKAAYSQGLGNPGNRPEENPGNRPDEHPGNRPDEHPGNRPDEHPGNRPEENPGNRPDEHPGNRPDEHPGNRPDEHPGNRPDEHPGNRPDEFPGNVPDDNPGNVPDEFPGNVPDGFPGNGPRDRDDGVWFDPGHNGQGLQFDPNDDGTLLSGAWYLYDENGKGFWVTLLGPRLNAANPSVSVELFRFTGPPLGTAYDPQNVVATVVGTATLFVNGNGEVSFEYTVEGVPGSLSLQPFTPEDDGPLSGVWFDPAFSGQGVTLSQNGEEIAGAWYFYDEFGQAQWVSFVGELVDGRLETELLSFSGPALGTPYAGELVDDVPVGSLTLIIEDDDSVRFEFELTVDGGDNHTGTLELNPFDFR